MASAWRARLGEKTTEMKNTHVERSTIAGPEGISQSAERSTPATEETIPMISEYHVNVDRLWVNWYAVEAGMRTMAKTRIAPTVLSETTTVHATRVSNKKKIRLAGMPEASASS